MCEEIVTPITVRNLFHMVKPYVLQHCGSMEDVEDTLQEGLFKFIKFYEKNGFDQVDKLDNYIFSICKNIWLKELENRQKIKQSGRFIVEELMDNSWALKEKQRKEAFNVIFEKNFGLLSYKCQKVLKYKLDGLTCNEIAVLLGLKNGQIAKDKHYRCKERLRELIKQDKAYWALLNDE